MGNITGQKENALTELGHSDQAQESRGSGNAKNICQKQSHAKWTSMEIDPWTQCSLELLAKKLVQKPPPL